MHACIHAYVHGDSFVRGSPAAWMDGWILVETGFHGSPWRPMETHGRTSRDLCDISEPVESSFRKKMADLQVDLLLLHDGWIDGPPRTSRAFAWISMERPRSFIGGRGLFAVVDHE